MARLEKLTRDKHSSLLRELIHYGQKSFIIWSQSVGDTEKKFYKSDTWKCEIRLRLELSTGLYNKHDYARN
jgi:hypothetical protein